MHDRRMTIDSPNLTRNGKFRLATLDALDGTLAAKNALSQIQGLEQQYGGAANLTFAERLLLRDAGFLGAIIEDGAARKIGGKPVNVADLCTAIGTRRRILSMFGPGFAVPAEDVTPPDRPEKGAAEVLDKIIADRGAPLLGGIFEHSRSRHANAHGSVGQMCHP